MMPRRLSQLLVGATTATTTTIRYSKCGPFFVYLEHQVRQDPEDLGYVI